MEGSQKKKATRNLESSSKGKNYNFATSLRFVDQIYKVVGCPYCLILLNYCTVYVETKSAVLQPNMSLGLKHWKIIITLIIFLCDVKKNPEPYNIAGIIQASFSLGHEKFGVTRGIQCTCISLYSACLSSFKPIFEWSSEDLEYVIVNGDQSYKEQNTLTLSSC